MTALLATFAALLPAADHKPAPCQTVACRERVAVRQRRRKMRRVVRPFRPWLERLGGCETRGYSRSAAYRAFTPPFYGRFQFTVSTWKAAGAPGLPHTATPLRQDYTAVVWRLRIGEPRQTAGWPVCG